MDNEKKIVSGFILLFIVMIVCCGGYNLLYIGTEAHITAKVNHKERVTFSSGEGFESKYLVYTDLETFEVTDSIFYGRFNSADTYGQIRVGQTYNFKVVGWRMPLFSQYRNILTASWIER